MRYCWLVLVLFCFLVLQQTVVLGQTVVLHPPTGKKAPDPVSGVDPQTPVITVEGFCDTAAKAKSAANGSQTTAESTSTPPANSNCKTVITREQFDRIMEILGPQMPPEAQFSLAARYPEMLVFARQARQLGLEKDPKFEEAVSFGYNQVLAQAFNKYLREKEVTDAEVEKFYKENPAVFEEVELQQLFIPNSKEHPPKPGSTAEPKVDKAADAAAMKLEAEKVHTEAVAGADFEKLEAEAYTVFGDPDDVPDTDMGKMSLADLPKQYQKDVSALQPGKISEVLAAENGWNIFKLVSRRTIPVSEAKPIAQKRLFQTTMDSLRGSIKPQLNDAYFKALVSPPTPPGGGQIPPPRP